MENTVSERVAQALLRVEGMSCTGCEQRIGKVLARIEGVHRVAADHATGQVQVSYDPDLVQTSALAQRVERAGYRVSGSEAAES